MILTIACIVAVSVLDDERKVCFKEFPVSPLKMCDFRVIVTMFQINVLVLIYFFK